MKKSKPWSKGQKVIMGLLSLFLILCLIAGIGALRGRFDFTVSHYTVSSRKLTDNFRVVQLSDLHNREYGENNIQLLDAVREQNPDLILFTGDLIVERQPEREPALALLEELTKIAPVYVSLGNHEIEYTDRFDKDFLTRIENTGARLLEREYVDLEVKGQKLRLGGIFGYCLPAKYLQTGEADREECDFLWDFQNTERHTILMCHMPVCWLTNGSLDAWEVDTVFSGHAHGGQVRLPLVGGIYAPDQGFFPGWVEGDTVSQNGQKHLIISRGLGSSVPLPRIFNVPELVVTDFTPAE